MTSQREVKFRKWYDKFKEDTQITFGLASEFNECWKACEADQAEYIALLELNNKFKDDANKKLREALEFECGGRCNAEYNPCNAREVLQALGETK